MILASHIVYVRIISSIESKLQSLRGNSTEVTNSFLSTATECIAQLNTLGVYTYILV